VELLAPPPPPQAPLHYRSPPMNGMPYSAPDGQAPMMGHAPAYGPPAGPTLVSHQDFQMAAGMYGGGEPGLDYRQAPPGLVSHHSEPARAFAHEFCMPPQGVMKTVSAPALIGMARGWEEGEDGLSPQTSTASTGSSSSSLHTQPQSSQRPAAMPLRMAAWSEGRWQDVERSSV
jgi:hypothetical protein